MSEETEKKTEYLNGNFGKEVSENVADFLLRVAKIMNSEAEKSPSPITPKVLRKACDLVMETTLELDEDFVHAIRSMFETSIPKANLVLQKRGRAGDISHRLELLGKYAGLVEDSIIMMEIQLTKVEEIAEEMRKVIAMSKEENNITIDNLLEIERTK